MIFENTRREARERSVSAPSSSVQHPAQPRSSTILALFGAAWLTCGCSPSPTRAQVIDVEEAAEAPLTDTWSVDVGDGWVPPLLDDGVDASGRPQPHRFRETFVALASADWPDTDLGRRAQSDEFLETYGIPPTLTLLRDRLRALAAQDCPHPRAILERFLGSGVDEDDRVDVEREDDGALASRRLGLGDIRRARAPRLRERRTMAELAPQMSWRAGLAATRARLVCEGHLEAPVPNAPALDGRTRRALERFERQHRIYQRGSLSGATLRALRIDARELARRDVLRVITERVSLDQALLGDGTADGDNLEAQLQDHLERELGLESFESTLAWLESLGDLDGRQRVAIAPLPLPAWWDEITDLEVEIDRGDVWFDFPFDEDGTPRSFPVERRPMLSVFAIVGETRREIVRWPTTIGGWRLERVRQRDVWRYKESPAGTFVWNQIVSAPVWLPPSSTPAADLVTERVIENDGSMHIELNTTLLGPGYASAYGLAAAYHLPARPRPDGTWATGADEGIRTHGSVDYTSVWRRASHGCHRLQNHRALALYSFVLGHRENARVGHARVDFRRTVEVDGVQQQLNIQHGGYVFRLQRPLVVRVLPGRIRGLPRPPPPPEAR